MLEITYVTGNADKINSAKLYLEPLGVKVNHIKMDTPELQSDSVEEIAKYSAKYASEKLQINAMKNDTGFYVEALNGFPAAYSHYVEDTLGARGLLKLLDGETNRNAKFIECFAYCEYGKEPVIFKSITHGTIDVKMYDDGKLGWDSVFIPEGQTMPLAYFPRNERYLLWDTTGYDEIVAYLKSREELN